MSCILQHKTCIIIIAIITSHKLQKQQSNKSKNMRVNERERERKMENFFNNSTIQNIAQVMPCRYDCSNVWIVPKGNETINNNALLGLVIIPDFIKILVIVSSLVNYINIFGSSPFVASDDARRGSLMELARDNGKNVMKLSFCSQVQMLGKFYFERFFKKKLKA